MIDFANKPFMNLSRVPDETFCSLVQPILIQGETIIQSFQSFRDGVIFTNRRILSINVQGMRGKKKDFSSLPYSKIQAFSVETAGTFDIDSELELWFSGLGKVKFEFSSKTDICEICRLIGERIL